MIDPARNTLQMDWSAVQQHTAQAAGNVVADLTSELGTARAMNDALTTRLSAALAEIAELRQQLEPARSDAASGEQTEDQAGDGQQTASPL